MTFSLGYLMGIIVGEGSFTHGPRLRVGIQESDPEPVRALQARFGGKIYGPYSTTNSSGTVTRQWQWQVTGKPLWKAIPIFDQYLPHSRKRLQYEQWKQKHASWLKYQARQEPQPAYQGPGVSRMPSRDVQEARRAARASRKPR